MGVSYIVLGTIDFRPLMGEVIELARSAPRAGALYRARHWAMSSARTEFVCLLDGGEDALLPGFEASIERRMLAMRRTGAAIGYADELKNGELVENGEFSIDAHLRRPLMLHADVVCRTEALKAIEWPSGCYWFEAVCYGTLARQGFVYDREAVYDWHPSPGGARLWPDTARAVQNSLRWLQGLPGIHFPKDFED